MTRTWYLRDRTIGRIVNAVEGDGLTRAQAEEVFQYALEDHFLDERPPIAELQAYKFWNERP